MLPRSRKYTVIEVALALRDFFLCSNAAEFASFWQSFTGSELASPAELEFEFNRLFVGPTSPSAPPYASVYLEKEPRLMGQTTMQVRALYRSMALAAPQGMPDDFLPYEIEAWLLLDEMDQAAKGWFLAHLGAWLPLFLERLERHGLSPEMRTITACLAQWLKGIQK